MVKTVIVFDLAVFDYILILNLVMAKINSIFVVLAFFWSYKSCENLLNLERNFYLLKNIVTILFFLQHLLLYQIWIKGITKTIFNINDIKDDLESKILLFADDTTLIATGLNKDMTSAQITRDLIKFELWAQTWKVTFNGDK